MVNGRCIEYRSDPVMEHDVGILGIGLTQDSHVQQAFGAFALFVALRHWASQWKDKRRGKELWMSIKMPMGSYASNGQS